MATVELRRPARKQQRPPGGELVLEAPPEPERVVPPGMLARLMPLMMLVGAVAFIAMGPENPMNWMFGGMFALSTVGMLAAGSGRSGGARTADIDEDRRDYLRYLDTVRARVREIAARQRRRAEAVHPEPAAWPGVLAAGRVWERRPADDDFGHVRMGRGAQRLATRLDRAADGAGRGRRAGHRVGVAAVPAGPLRGARPAGRPVVAGQLHRVAGAGPAGLATWGPRGRWPARSSRSTRCGTAPTRPCWPSSRHRPPRRRGSGRSGCRTWSTGAGATPSARCG